MPGNTQKSLNALKMTKMEFSDKSPEMIIIAGPNGSGKTTITNQFLHHEWSEGTLYINPDIVCPGKIRRLELKTSVIKAAIYCEDLREQMPQRKALFCI